MFTKHLALALLGTALVSAPALAQNQAPAPATGSNTSTSTMSTSPSNASSGMTQLQPGQWRASKLDGLNVYNDNNEKIGDISELLVDQSGKIQAVVIGVGGFLGMGEHDVAIPFEQVKITNEPRAASTASNTTTGTAGMSNTTAANPNAPATTGSTASTNTTAANNANEGTPDHAVVNMTKDQLKAMPEFKYKR